jgi:hypothetical protein
MISVGFIKKTVKVNLDVRINHAYPQPKRPQKILEDPKGLRTKAEGETPPDACRPVPCRGNGRQQRLAVEGTPCSFAATECEVKPTAVPILLGEHETLGLFR